MSEVERYDWDEEGMLSEFSGYKGIEGHWVKSSDYDALAAQRDEGLARETAAGEIFAGGVARLDERNAKLQQRLSEAEKHLSLMIEESDALRVEVNEAWAYAGSTGAGTQASSEWVAAKAFLASPGCADGERS